MGDHATPESSSSCAFVHQWECTCGTPLAVLAAARTREYTALSGLLELVEDRRRWGWDITFRAIEALGRLRDDHAVPCLVRVLLDPQIAGGSAKEGLWAAYLQGYAILALQAIGGREATGVLQGLAADQRVRVWLAPSAKELAARAASAAAKGPETTAE